MKHLYRHEYDAWCDPDLIVGEGTYDPRDATCCDCLKRAAAYGAAAAMRYAAVEAIAECPKCNSTLRLVP